MSDISRETVVKTGVSSAPGSAPKLWICRVVSGPNAQQEVAIGARGVTIGADAECDLTLKDPAVSRRHATIRATREGIAIEDLGSTNGTFYRSGRVTSAILPAEATIVIGNTTIRLFTQAMPSVPASPRNRFGGLIGESTIMREVFAVLELASPTEASVIIEGESGTGKELAARSIHDHSARASGPFVIVDCSSVHEQSLESHLFGHRPGAFTGAVGERKGAFVEAHGGTVFLDEIGELSPAAQARLLRAIESRTVQPLGSDRPVEIDVRIVAATNRDLAEMIEDQRFRFDLFHRLAVVHVRMPSLRERPEDIRALVHHFYEGRGVNAGTVDGDNLSQLRGYDWPGNVRELRNVLERAWVLHGEEWPIFCDLALHIRTAFERESHSIDDTSLPFKEAKERWLGHFEKRYIAAVFATCDNNISRAAEHAGINRNHFRKLLNKHGLKKS